MEYHFKCEKCGTDIGEGASRSDGSGSINLTAGIANLLEQTGIDQDVLRGISLDCHIQLKKGTFGDNIPSIRMKAEDGSEIPVSVTIEGTCPKCGTSFIRKLRQQP